VETIWVKKREFRELKQLIVRERWDWPAVFSCNAQGDIWPFVVRGYTQPPDRIGVRGASGLLDQVADSFVHSRPIGGRFFIDRRGACCKDDGEEQFLRFVLYGR